MPSVTVVLPESLEAVLRQTVASNGRSVESVVNTDPFLWTLVYSRMGCGSANRPETSRGAVARRG
jgi:hypothetical protein